MSVANRLDFGHDQPDLCSRVCETSYHIPLQSLWKENTPWLAGNIIVVAYSRINIFWLIFLYSNESFQKGQEWLKRDYMLQKQALRCYQTGKIMMMYGNTRIFYHK